MEKLVLINLSDSEYQKVKTIASRMKIATDRIPQEYLGCTLGQFADGTYKGKMEQPVSAEMQESVILFCNLKDKRLDKMLFELRHGAVDVTYKAILTPTNQNWTLTALLRELRREQFAMLRSRKN